MRADREKNHQVHTFFGKIGKHISKEGNITPEFAIEQNYFPMQKTKPKKYEKWQVSTNKSITFEAAINKTQPEVLMKFEADCWKKIPDAFSGLSDYSNTTKQFRIT